MLINYLPGIPWRLAVWIPGMLPVPDQGLYAILKFKILLNIYEARSLRQQT